MQRVTASRSPGTRLCGCCWVTFLNILNSLELRETGTPAPCPCSGLIESLRDVLLGQVRRECSGQWLAHFAPQGATAPLVQAPGWTASRPDAESQPLKGFGHLRLGHSAPSEAIGSWGSLSRA